MIPECPTCGLPLLYAPDVAPHERHERRKDHCPKCGPLPTSERLARDLEAVDCGILAAAARLGEFDDFKSESATPIGDLVRRLEVVAGVHPRGAELLKIAEAARAGRYDATEAEAQAWARSREGREALASLAPGPGRE